MEQERLIPELTELTEEQRAGADKRFEVVRVYVEEGVSQREIVRAYGVPLATLQRWIRRYREAGLRGLARLPRADRGKRRGVSEEVVKVIEGLALRKPRQSMATIQRQVSAMAL